MASIDPIEPDPAERAVYRRAGRDLLVALLALAVLGSIVGWLIAGQAGLLGALIGAGLAALVTLPTPFTGAASARFSPTMSAAVLMGAWLLKFAILVLVLAVLRNQFWFHRGMMFAVVLLGVILGAITLSRAMLKGRVPYVKPENRKP